MKQETKEKIGNGIVLGLLTIFFLFCFLYIGSPIMDNAKILNVVILGISLLYLLIRKVFGKKVTLLGSKLDVAVFILCLSAGIPILMGKQASTTEAFLYLLKYMAVFASYLVGREIAKEKPVYVRLLIHAVFLAGILVYVCGIDDMTTQYTKDFFLNLGNVDIAYTEPRIMGAFGYPNAFAAYMAFCFMLSVGQYVAASKKIVKGIYAGLTFIFFSGVLLTYSKAMFLVLPVVFLLFLLSLRKKEKIVPTIGMMSLVGITSIVYAAIYSSFLNKKEYLLLWAISIFLPFFVAGITMVIQNTIDHIAKWKTRHLVEIIVALFLAIVTFLVVGMHLKKPLVLFQTQEASEELKQVLIDLEPNTDYEFVFDIEAVAKNGSDQAYQIELLQENKYYDTIEVTTDNFGTFTGQKTIHIKTKEDFVELSMTFKNKEKENRQSLLVKGLWINGKEKILQYRYLPQTLVSKIENINFSNKSTWERFVYMQTALRMIAKDPVFGIGGGGWEYQYQEVQPYLYYAKQVHCYPLQIWLEFGIVGIVSYLAIVTLILILLGKEYRRKMQQEDIETERNSVMYLSILMALLVLFAHSIFDFEMSFVSILLLVFVLLGVASTWGCHLQEEKEKVQKEENKQERKIQQIAKQVLEIIVILYLVSGFILNLGDYIGRKDKVEYQNAMQDYQEKCNKIDRNIKLAPYNRAIRKNKVGYLQTYKALKRQDSVLLQDEKEEVTKEILEQYEWMMKHEPNSYTKDNYSEYFFQINDTMDEQLQLKHLHLLYDKIKEGWNEAPLDYKNVWFQYSNAIEAAKLAHKIYTYHGKEEIKQLEFKFYQLVVEHCDEDIKTLQDRNRTRAKKEETDQLVEMLNHRKQEVISELEK